MSVMRACWFSISCLLVALTSARLAPAAPQRTAGPETAPAPAQDEPERPQRARVEKLRQLAAGEDPAAASAALDELKSLGEPAREVFVGSLRLVLARDRAAIEDAAKAPGAARFKETLGELDETRKAAWENLRQLEKGEPVEKAEGYYKDLAKLRKRLNKAMEARAPAAAALARREALLAMYREAAGDAAVDSNFPADTEAELVAVAERGLGATADAIRSIPELAADKNPGPSDPVARHYWLYLVSRRIEAYNKSLKGVQTAGERHNLKLVNDYRESLGLLPYELDARLTQAARRHSKEMADLKYFSHESPTEHLRWPIDRIRDAGYEPEGGAGENCALGFRTGQQAFEAWLHSPGHHRLIVSPDLTAVGVGRWDTYWTQNMSGGDRLMLMSEEQRKALKVKGDVVKPQK